MNRLSQRLLVGLLGAGAGLAMVTGAASAAPAHPMANSAPSAADLSAAHQAADTAAVHSRLGGFFADRGRPAKHEHSAARAAAARRMAPKLVGHTVPVYYLNPKFVSGTSDDVPVANLAYLATKAVSSDGQTAAVWTVRDPKHQGTWTEINIASGGDEFGYVTEADPGSVVFREPQINAWYAARDGHVMPLNDTARSSVGADGASLAYYQKLVHQRYAGKQAGSAYARKHTLGGFDTKPLANTEQAATGADDSPAVPVGVGLGAAGVLGVAGALVLRRRSRRTTA